MERNGDSVRQTERQKKKSKCLFLTYTPKEQTTEVVYLGSASGCSATGKIQLPKQGQPSVHSAFSPELAQDHSPRPNAYKGPGIVLRPDLKARNLLERDPPIDNLKPKRRSSSEPPLASWGTLRTRRIQSILICSGRQRQNQPIYRTNFGENVQLVSRAPDCRHVLLHFYPKRRRPKEPNFWWICVLVFVFLRQMSRGAWNGA